MKKLCFVILALFISLVTFANTEDFDYVNDGQQISYNSYNNLWTIGGINDDDIILYKKFYDGAGSYSQYLDSEDKIVFTLTTSLEFVKDGVLYAINNDEFKYYRIVYNGQDFEEIPLSYGEIQELFPDADIVSLALIDDDNKISIGLSVCPLSLVLSRHSAGGQGGNRH